MPSSLSLKLFLRWSQRDCALDLPIGGGVDGSALTRGSDGSCSCSSSEVGGVGWRGWGAARASAGTGAGRAALPCETRASSRAARVRWTHTDRDW